MAKSSKRKSIEPMEDDEDLELLRLEALKTLKKDTLTSAPIKSNAVKHIIPVVGNVRPITTKITPAMVIDKFYVPSEPTLVQPNLIHHPVPPYVNSGFEKMEISEPYIPQRINPIPSFNEYVPFGVTTNIPTISTDPITNVQLSPRTAAFVYENKQIIQRRQIKSPSPVPFRKSPGRWSRSPSPENWKYRRSTKSRSPTYTNHSPHFRKRSVSRSPQRRRHSPQPTHSRRNRTRSPIARNNFDGNNVHRTERRSPITNRRANSPNGRQPSRTWHGHPGQRENGLHSRKSGSPRCDDNLNHRRRRTRSPTNTQSDVRRRTSSRSPNRKFIRNNLNRPPRRSPPLKRFHNGNKLNHFGTRNRNNHGQRNGSHSPLNNHHRRKSPIKNTMENGSILKKSNTKDQLPTEQTEQQSMDVTPKNENDENKIIDKTNQNQNGENNSQTSSESENSDSDDNDGIDLFASEESESENEGRFKLTTRSERKENVPTVSFSELGKTTSAPAEILMRNLDDLQTDSNSHRHGTVRRENDRNRNRKDDRRYNNRNRERQNEERERERDRHKNRRDRERDTIKSKSNGPWKSSKSDDSRKKEENSNDGNVKSEKKHFKSTIGSVDSESRNKSPDGEKPLDVKSKLSSEKRSTIQIKRSMKSNETNVDTKNLQSTVDGSSTSDKRTSPSNESSTASKKPIHLRLGAMTNKWKSSKKAWRTEKV